MCGVQLVACPVGGGSAALCFDYMGIRLSQFWVASLHVGGPDACYGIVFGITICWPAFYGASATPGWGGRRAGLAVSELGALGLAPLLLLWGSLPLRDAP